MRILHIIFTLQYGGAETLLVDLMNQQMFDNEVSIFIINKDYASSLVLNIKKNINIINFNRGKGSFNFLKLFEVMMAIRNLKPDVIHCHDSKAILFIPPFYYSKSLLTVHGTALALRGLKLYKYIVSISKAVADDVLNRKGVQSHIIYNGINISQIEKKESNENDTFNLVHVARLHHRIKGQHIILEAISILKSKYNISCHIDFIGEGPSRSFLEQKIDKLHLQDNARLLGQRDRDYIYKNLCHYDMLVQPSLYEGFGLSIIEAMAAEVPVFVSNIEGPMEVIGNGKYGFYFESNNAHDCADKLYYLYKNPKKRHEIIKEALQYCENNFSMDIMVHNYGEIYKMIRKIN